MKKLLFIKKYYFVPILILTLFSVLILSFIFGYKNAKISASEKYAYTHSSTDEYYGYHCVKFTNSDKIVYTPTGANFDTPEQCLAYDDNQVIESTKNNLLCLPISTGIFYFRGNPHGSSNECQAAANDYIYTYVAPLNKNKSATSTTAGQYSCKVKDKIYTNRNEATSAWKTYLHETIDKLYSELLLRPTNPNDYNYWENYITLKCNSTINESEIKSIIENSDEFKALKSKQNIDSLNKQVTGTNTDQKGNDSKTSIFSKISAWFTQTYHKFIDLF